MAKKIDTSTMVYIGRFNEDEVRSKKDKEAVKKAKELAPAFKYTHTEFVFKGKKIVGLDVWLTTQCI